MKIMLSKALVFAVIVLFIGAGVIPSISGYIEKNNEFYDKNYYGQNNNDFILDQYQEIFNDRCGMVVNSEQKSAQTFKPSMTNLVKIELAIGSGEYTDSPLIVSIRESLSGSDLVSVSVPSNQISIWPPIIFNEIDIPDISVIPDHTYYIVVECKGQGAYTFSDNYLYNNNYVRGSEWGYWDHGGGNYYWREYEDGDFAFRTYGTGLGNPAIEVQEIQGGFRINAVLKNYGTATAIDVPWSIELNGGFILMGGSSDGTIPTLEAGENKTVRLDSLFGVGTTTITVTAGDAVKKATAFILGPLVLNVQEI